MKNTKKKHVRYIWDIVIKVNKRKIGTPELGKRKQWTRSNIVVGNG